VRVCVCVCGLYSPVVHAYDVIGSSECMLHV
jgi:hypothetical protein